MVNLLPVLALNIGVQGTAISIIFTLLSTHYYNNYYYSNTSHDKPGAEREIWKVYAGPEKGTLGAYLL